MSPHIISWPSQGKPAPIEYTGIVNFLAINSVTSGGTASNNSAKAPAS